MRNLQSFNRSSSCSIPSGQIGGFADSFGDNYKELVEKANTVSFPDLLRYYGINIDENNRKIICPFPSHKGGREATPSFYYYPQTNTFWCFGCKIGVGCCDFVAAKERISKIKAAQKIINLFNLKIEDGINVEEASFTNPNERLEILLEFSDLVREFREKNRSEKDLIFIEEISSVFDKINLKHNLDNLGLKSLINKLKVKIENYDK
jgi:DNA primase